MIIYHGHPSPDSIKKCREAAPSYTHGAEWSPAKMTPHDWPYILDNGAFHAFTNSVPWDATGFVRRVVEIADRMPREPDFIVLPDVVSNAKDTLKRSETWAKHLKEYGLPIALAVQDGMNPTHVVEPIAAWDLDAIFVGGTAEWKRRNAESFGNTAEQFGLQFHIGRPGNLQWAKQIGADSIDTTSIVHNGTFDKLRTLEQQATLIIDGGSCNARSVDTGSDWS